ncbi:MAG: FAD-binding oxidoreductase [Candidatus Acidiferrum sp.]
MMETATSAREFRNSKQIEEQLRGVVGAEFVSATDANDAVFGVQAQLVVTPGNEAEVAAVLRCANEAGISVIPRGGGTKLEWGNAPVRGELILSLARLNRVLDHAWADLTVSVEAGCTLQLLQETLAQQGQRLALDPLWPARATIGGVLSTNDSGALRLRFGALRDLIIGVTLALPDGTLASSGGRVVKNVAGYDLPKLATGALGTLGVITRAFFRLHPVCPSSLSVSFNAADVVEMQTKILAIQDSKLAHTGFQIRCGGEMGGALVAELLLEATEAGLVAQQQQVRTMVGSLEIAEKQVWRARQELWSGASENSAVVKTSVLPALIAKTIRLVESAAKGAHLGWKAVFQATGIGWLRLDGPAGALAAVVNSLRSALEGDGGSLVIAHRSRSKEMSAIDAWGNPGDALPLMRALKNRLDPRNTLNPGRFVGGI